MKWTGFVERPYVRCRFAVKDRQDEAAIINTEFERGRVVGIRENGFSFRNTAERLGRNVSTVHDCWQQWSREGSASIRPGSGRPHGTTERENRRVAVEHRTASAAEIPAAVGNTVKIRTVTNQLLQGQLRARRPVACIPLTPNHCRLRREWCRARAHWRIKRRSVVLSDERQFCLCASDGRVLVRRRTCERLQPTCLLLRHTGPTPGIMVWRAISYDSRSTLVVIPRTLTENLHAILVIQPVVLPFMNSIQGGVFQDDNSRPHIAVAPQNALQSVDMLPWPARSPDISPIEHVWTYIGR
ncbi:Transposable element Tcb2 transposase [Araneus ventricosus]|uniref:Transposable element Tcb2 transposase n=1 Tax=Araneus ventricosus TaxID=182803 RepID=A0A4Y2IF20_ARAVE|nr:Transposable element Tcb2 transposase [Araneus ventricosus]